MRKKVLVLGVCTSLVFAGCGSVDDAQQGKSEGLNSGWDVKSADIETVNPEKAGIQNDGVTPTVVPTESVFVEVTPTEEARVDVKVDSGNGLSVEPMVTPYGDAEVSVGSDVILPGGLEYVDIGLNLSYGLTVDDESGSMDASFNLVADKDTVHVVGSAEVKADGEIVPSESIDAWLQYNDTGVATAYIWDEFAEAWSMEDFVDDFNINEVFDMTSVELPDWLKFDASGVFSAEFTVGQLMEMFSDVLEEQLGEFDLSELEEVEGYDEFKQFLDARFSIVVKKDLQTGYIAMIKVSSDGFEVEGLKLDGLNLEVVVNESLADHEQFDIPVGVLESATATGSDVWMDDSATVEGVPSDSIAAAGLGIYTPISYREVSQMLGVAVDDVNVLERMAEYINDYSYYEFYQMIGKWDGMDDVAKQAAAYLCVLEVVNYGVCVEYGADSAELDALMSREFD